MPIELKIPVVGESITEVQISAWLKAEGDTVQKDEPLAVIDSEKTTFELPAPQGGTLTKILRQAGDTVKVGEVIAELDPSGQTASAPQSEKSKAKRTPAPSEPAAPPPPAKEPRRTPAEKPDPAAPAATDEPVSAEAPAYSLSPRGTSGERAGPSPRRSGFGRAGGVRGNSYDQPTSSPPPSPPSEGGEGVRPPATESQPRRAQEAAPPIERKPALSPKSSPEREEQTVPMTMLRRTIARRLVEAQQTMAMLTTFNEVDMDAVQKLRHQHQEEFQKRYGVKLGLMSFFVKAAIDALKQFPQLNAEVRGNDIVYRNYFDIGVAVASERGLVVPVLRRAERLSFAEVEKAIADLARRATDGALNPEELEGGTFTITNGGVFGSLLSTPIINPPQSGILGLHSMQDRPVARDGAVVIRPMMFLALTYDHRIVDGREAVLFLRRVKDAVEDPVRMLVEI